MGSNEIDLSENAPELVGAMLRSMYGESYEFCSGFDDVRDISELGFHAAMVAIGDKYDVPGLVKFALKKFRNRLFLERADYFVGILFRIVAPIYNLLPDKNRSLRDPIVHAVAREYLMLRTIDDGVFPEEIREKSEEIRKLAIRELVEVVHTHPQFAGDMVTALSMLNPATDLHGFAFGTSNNDRKQWLNCTECNDIFHLQGALPWEKQYRLLVHLQRLSHIGYS